MKHPLNANIPIKKTLSIGFIAMLILTIAIVMMPASVPVSAATVPAQSIFIDPTYPDPAVTNLEVNDTFTVDVMVNVTAPTSASGTGLFGTAWKLFWNLTYINLTSYTTHIPAGWKPPAGFLVQDETGVSPGGHTTLPPEKDGLGYHLYGYTCLTGPPFTGVMSLCTYNFEVTDQPTYPDPDFNGILDLWNVKMADDAAVVFISDGEGAGVPPATGTVQDGVYEVSAEVLPAPMLKIEPSLVEGVFGENFTVNIRIKGLDEAFNLSSWEAKLGYNTTMLDALASANGTFLQGFAGLGGTYYNSTINDTLGIIDMEGGFNGTHLKPSGSGVLATVTFNASWRYTVPPGIPPVTSALNLYDTTLLDGAGLSITHDTTDGTYKAPYEDNDPPNIGDPARIPAGDVLPNVSVKILVSVTDESGVKSVWLQFTTGDGTTWEPWPPDLEAYRWHMTYNSTSGLYEVLLSNQEVGTWVKFKITAEDNRGNTVTRDGTSPYFRYEVVPEFPAALIMPLFMIAALVAVILGKTAWSRKRKSSYVAK